VIISPVIKNYTFYLSKTFKCKMFEYSKTIC